MTTRLKKWFTWGHQWTDTHDGYTYCYGTLTQKGYDQINEGTVGKQYTCKIGAQDKCDAPNPPFETSEGGHWNE